MEDAYENMPTDTLENGNNILAEAENCSHLETSSSSDASRANEHIETFQYVHPGEGLSRHAMSWAEASLPYTTQYSTEDAGLIVEVVNASNYQNPNSDINNISSVHASGDYRRHPYQMASGTRNRIEDPSLMSKRNGKSRMPLRLQDHKLLQEKQYNEASSFVSHHLITSYKKNVRSSILPLREKQPTILPSSNFSTLFCNQYSEGKGAFSRNSHTSSDYLVTEMDHKKDKMDSANNTPLQQTNEQESPEAYCEGISIRDWLKLRFGTISKVQRLHLFTQIVQLVDFAHSQGIALPHLRLSSFNLLQSCKVIYSDPSIPKELLNVINQRINGKRALEQEDGGVHNESSIKHRKLEEGVKSFGDQKQFTSRASSNRKLVSKINSKTKQGVDYNEYEAQQQITFCFVTDQLEKKWYACPEELNERGLLSSNIYSLGILLFELLSSFESSEMQLAAMLDLRNRIIPPNFLSEYPQESGFCLWLLHPDPSSRPTTREILHSELILKTEELYSKSFSSLSVCTADDSEAELLHDFLTSLREQKQKHASALIQNIESLETDIKEVKDKHITGSSISSNMFKSTLLSNISQLESAYFHKRSHVQTTETGSIERSDKDLLTNREKRFARQIENEGPSIGKKADGPLGEFFQGMCKFARYNKLEVCGALNNVDLLNSGDVISSMSFNRDEDYIATAGVSKKIKIFEFASLLSDLVDINYPALDLSNESKLSCVCWNKYVKNYLASADYDGVVQIWDASAGQGISRYIEHEKRAWSVDFSQVDPTKFASGSDDCSVKLWSINEKKSTATIRNQANVCCVQFSAYSSHLLAFGSADYRIYCYDIRNTHIPWCTLAGHKKAVSYVKFLDPETIVSASTDNTLKLWDLKNTTLEGLSSSACTRTFTGHTNEKNFVGLAVLNGYIACGSETNEVYAYYRTLPMPITSYKFGCVDPISGDEIKDDNGRFISNICWREKSNMVVAANSVGNLKVLQMS